MIKIVVNGRPAPQGSKRHVGGGRMVEQSKAVGPWRDAVRGETQRAIEVPYPGAVSVWVEFRLRRPKGHYGTGRNALVLKASAPRYPAVTPDLDKLARSTLDGLKTGGAYWDDAQVVQLTARKRYGETEGADIVIEEIG